MRSWLVYIEQEKQDKGAVLLSFGCFLDKKWIVLCFQLDFGPFFVMV